MKFAIRFDILVAALLVIGAVYVSNLAVTLTVSLLVGLLLSYWDYQRSEQGAKRPTMFPRLVAITAIWVMGGLAAMLVDLGLLLYELNQVAATAIVGILLVAGMWAMGANLSVFVNRTWGLTAPTANPA